ncbi:hypothetical protein BD310DRAFT_514557 [Dichomitus squalens]|uniref:Uncharacterized protein n=1 Tax=Dichomitus squalens TaxID=114155 RepID=A0A4Q9PTS9_9APHY|nr:hypothetical protein BD310DRAFT_514557 [Dichomitus squalens]
MGTYTMTCVGYDAGFLNTLVRNAHNYVEERKTSENREKRVTKNGKENTSKRRKPKNIEPESDGDHASSLVLSAEEEYADDKPPDDTQSRSSGRPARSKRRRMT